MRPAFRRGDLFIAMADVRGTRPLKGGCIAVEASHGRTYYLDADESDWFRRHVLSRLDEGFIDLDQMGDASS